MNLIKYRNQWLILSFIAILVLIVFLDSPRLETLENHLNLAAECGLVAICIFLLFRIEEIKSTTRIYRVLLASTSLLILSAGIDVVDEFSEISSNAEMLEDTLKPIGLFLFISACFQWVNFHKAQLDLVQKLADMDPLTGLYNRRSLMNLSNDFFNGYAQSSKATSLLIMDIDRFKVLNDTYGHQFGDKVLVMIAGAIKKVIRQDDFLARIGGEEFILILKNTDEVKAKMIAEKVRLCVENLSIECAGQQVSCSISIGFASVYEDAATFEQLYSFADKAMYQAKERGRNQSCQYHLQTGEIS